jgi:hypothetical protein
VHDLDPLAFGLLDQHLFLPLALDNPLEQRSLAPGPLGVADGGAFVGEFFDLLGEPLDYLISEYPSDEAEGIGDVGNLATQGEKLDWQSMRDRFLRIRETGFWVEFSRSRGAIRAHRLPI